MGTGPGGRDRIAEYCGNVGSRGGSCLCCPNSIACRALAVKSHVASAQRRYGLGVGAEWALAPQALGPGRVVDNHCSNQDVVQQPVPLVEETDQENQWGEE